MAESLVQVTEGSGKKLHTWSRTIGANTVEDEFTIPGEYPMAAYILSTASNVGGATTGDDLLQLMAGASLNLRIRRVRIESAGITAAAIATFQLARVTSAGTGGTAITPVKFDNADAAAGATGASGVPNASHGTIGSIFFTRSMYPVQTPGAAGGPSPNPFWEWVQQPGMKPIIVPAGTTNGIVIRNSVGRAGSAYYLEMEFVETSFV